jgi:hypothetical protein
MQWKSNLWYTFWVCVCSLNYPACNALAPYCNMWPVLLYNTFPPFVINDTIAEKKLLNINWAFWFSLQICMNHFSLYEEFSEMWSKIYILVFSKISIILVQILMEIEFCRQIFEKFSNFIFHENPSSGSQVPPCGRTDRHDEANSH